jgi:hypothetical protein
MPDSRGFLIAKYYCGHCLLIPDHSHGFDQKYDVKQHVAESHDIKPMHQEEGKDFFNGFLAMQLHSRRSSHAHRESLRARKRLAWNLYTVEDFLTDCGD